MEERGHKKCYSTYRSYTCDEQTLPWGGGGAEGTDGEEGCQAAIFLWQG